MEFTLKKEPHPPTDEAAPDAAAPPGTLLTDIGLVRCFGSGDIAGAGLGRGWAAPEESHCWNDGPDALLTLATARAERLAALVIEGAPLIVPARRRQDLTLYGNGLRLGFWRFSEPRTAQLEVLIEPWHWRRRGEFHVLALAFHLPDSLRLSSIEPNGDDRELGFCFRTLALFAA
jgi:hypothetical protein